MGSAMCRGQRCCCCSYTRPRGESEVKRTPVVSDHVCVCTCGRDGKHGAPTPRSDMHTWPRRLPPPTTTTTTMGPHRTLLLLILIRVATGAPMEGDAPQPTVSLQDQEAMISFSGSPLSQTPDQGNVQRTDNFTKDVHGSPLPQIPNLNYLLLPKNFTIHRHCLQAIVQALCGSVFYNPRVDELEATRERSSFTCSGEDCRLQQLARYCNKTPDFLIQDPSQSHPVGTSALRSHDHQPLHGTLQTHYDPSPSIYNVQDRDFPTESQKQEENGSLRLRNNLRPFLTRYGDYINVEKIQEVGLSCTRKYYCIVWDCCPIFHKRSVSKLLMETAYESLVNRRKPTQPRQSSRGIGRRLRGRRRPIGLYSRSRAVRRMRSPKNLSLEHSGPQHVLQHP